MFSLDAAELLGTIAGTYQQTLEGAGDTPKVDAAMLKEIVRKALPGRSDEEYVEFDSEVDAALNLADLFSRALEKLENGSGLSVENRARSVLQALGRPIDKEQVPLLVMALLDWMSHATKALPDGTSNLGAVRHFIEPRWPTEEEKQ